MIRPIRILAVICLPLLCCSAVFSGKVIEEIVAKVNDDIITKSEFELYERELTREIYSNYTGDELDQKLKDARDYLLYNLVNEKLLFQKAEQQYDMKKLGESLIKEFRDQKNLKDKAAFDKFLSEGRLTEEELTNEMLKYQAPQMILTSLVRDKITVSDSEIETYYNKNIADFTSPEKVTVREIILMAAAEKQEEARKKGEEILERIKKKEDFAVLAEQFSDGATKSKGGLLGTFVKGELAPDLEAQVFAMKAGESSGLIETSYGFHIVKVDTREESQVKPLTEARFDIYESLSGEKYLEAVGALLTKMWDESTIEVNENYKNRLNIKHKVPDK